MKSFSWKQCLNPKILFVLGFIFILALIFLPSKSQTLAFLAPFLIVLICPLSMIFMAHGMNRTHSCRSRSDHQHKKSDEPKH